MPAPTAESSAAAPRLIDPAELEADLAQAEASWPASQPAEAEPAQATATRRERRKPGTALLVIPEPPKDGPENPPLPLERPATAAA
ncbi:MAG: hypothetical protein E7K72_22740 [Roseomonas mucosa]|nr:hypothetical protein [Roseomonas mucosa]